MCVRVRGKEKGGGEAREKEKTWEQHKYRGGKKAGRKEGKRDLARKRNREVDGRWTT